VKRYLVFIILVIFFIHNVSSSSPKHVENNPKEISGKIIDADTKEGLVGVNVLIKNTNIGASSDANGRFVIKQIPSYNFEIIITLVGYKSSVHKIDVNRDDITNLLFELRPAMIEMGTVVVTGTSSLHLYENVPVKTEIITKKLINQRNACNLAQALDLQTGIQVENDCSNCNFTQVRILGFDGRYSQILIDGDPVVSALGGVYGLEHYPQEMIEQIEIVKGGGSSLYGAGAIAGTINMITRRPAFNSAKISYMGSSLDGSYDQQIGAVAEIVSENNNSGFYVFGSTRAREQYDRNGDEFSELGILENKTVGFSGYLKMLEDTELQISLHKIFEERRGGSEFDKPVHEARIAEMTKHNKFGGKIKWVHKLSPVSKYKINYAFSILKRDSYYGGLADFTPEARIKALESYGYSENPLHSGGIQFNHMLNRHSFTVGFQYDNDRLLDRSAVSPLYFVNETFRNVGIYLQDEIKLDEEDNLQLVAGLRFDRHSSLENWVVSPRINFRYKLFEALSLRGGITSGFKAPQIFDEDLHIYVLEGTQRIIRNRSGLKEEKSFSYTLGVEFQDFVANIPILFGITGFYTKLNNAYTEEFINADKNIEYWERVNSTGAELKGFEVDFGIKPISRLEIRTGFTFKDNKFKNKLSDFDTRNFLRTPDIFGYIRTLFDFNSSLSGFASIKYMGGMYVPHEILVDNSDQPLLKLSKSPTFVEVDISLLYKLNIIEGLNSTLSIGIKNLTDAFQSDLDYGITRDPGYVYGPKQPRTIHFTLELSI
jgi:outer membrane receptor for ferrienterochelin and colicins